MSLALASFFALPPPHPILVNFTAALVPLSLLCDATGRIFKRTSLRDAGWWMIAFAAVVTPFTALTGWIWMRQSDQPATAYLTTHQWLGVTLAPIIVALALWRWWTQVRKANPSWRYLGVLFIIVTALVVQGHLGGLMSFGDEPTVDRSPVGTKSLDEAGTGGTGAATKAAPPGTTRAATQKIKEDGAWQQSIDLN